MTKSLENNDFYRTQVSLGSDLWVRFSLTDSLRHCSAKSCSPAYFLLVLSEVTSQMWSGIAVLGRAIGHPQLCFWFSASFVWKKSQLDYLVDRQS